jgi:Domain of unknown function (DUF1929)
MRHLPPGAAGFALLRLRAGACGIHGSYKGCHLPGHNVGSAHPRLSQTGDESWVVAAQHLGTHAHAVARVTAAGSLTGRERMMISGAGRGANGRRPPGDRLWPVPVASAAMIAAVLVLFACQDIVEPPNAERTSGAPSVVALKGEWGPTFSTGIVALHASLVPHANGGAAVLAWGHTGVPHLWVLSNSTPTFSPLGEPVELFCAGHNYLPDGSLLVVGGHDEVKGDGHGIANVYRFANGAWLTENSMHFARWYPTATTLADGDIIVYAGSDNDHVSVPTPERYSYATGTWTLLTKANRKLPYYPRSFLDPKNGKVFYAGEAPLGRWLDPQANAGLGKWSLTAARQVANRNYGSAVMYEQGKILYVGGGGQSVNGDELPTNTAEIIDLKQTTPQWTLTGAMMYGRRHTNLTILADGQVLVTGGTSSKGFTNRTLARREAEVWNPSTGNWTLLAAESKVRVYHGVSLLLPDGRVLSAASGDGRNLPKETNGQIFSPPYLFAPNGTPAARPQITGVSSAALQYGQSFTITTPQAASIAKVHLIRFSSVTHAFNQSQTLYRAVFTAAGGVLSVTAPATGRVAPPGPYLLFIVDDQGVPSEGKVVSLSQF